jgi:hypothetical protein
LHICLKDQKYHHTFDTCLNANLAIPNTFFMDFCENLKKLPNTFFMDLCKNFKKFPNTLFMELCKKLFKIPNIFFSGNFLESFKNFQTHFS